MTMRRFANHVIAVANSNSTKVTNLQLQKVMFFTMGFHMRETRRIDELVENTYTIPFEKWQYGPVVESIYHSYSIYRDKPIIESGELFNEYTRWNSLILRLLKMDVFKLVKTSHQMNAWARFETEILAKRYVEPYTLDEIFEDFTR